MRRILLCGLLAVAAGAFAVGLGSGPRGNESMAEEAKGDRQMLSHMVYFTLKDDSEQAQQKLVDACRKYLKGHPGTVFFAAGTRAREFDRPVNDTEFDVALNLVFKDKAAHDAYQDHPRHQQFIEENRENWEKVQVFDAYVND